MKAKLSPFAAILLLVLFVTALALTWFNFNIALPNSQWFKAMRQPDIDAIDQMLFHYSLLPRLAVSLLVGAGLGLVGVLFQQVLRNPLAEPTTLGVATGCPARNDRHHAVGASGRADFAICGAGRGVYRRGAGVRRGGASAFSGDADSGAGGQPVLRRYQPADGVIPSRPVKACSCGVPGTLTQTDWSVVQRLWPQLLGGVMLTLLLPASADPDGAR